MRSRKEILLDAEITTSFSDMIKLEILLDIRAELIKLNKIKL